MANKKKPNKQKAVSNKPASVKQPEKKGLLQEAKEPTKNEILFYRIGMIAVSLVVLVFVAFILINHFTKDDTVPYEDYVTITHSSLTEIVKDNGDSTYGDFTYFNGLDGYENIADLINKNDVIYFYFYHSSAIDTDVEAAILAQTSIGLIPTATLMTDNPDASFIAFILIDLDDAANGSLIADTSISYLDLNDTDTQFLVTFDIYNPDGTPFAMEEDSAKIVDIINNL